MILAGDVGGTKTILALYGQEDGHYRCVKKQRHASADYPTFTGLLAAFLEDPNAARITAACIGVAGPIVNGDCKTTNLPWVLIRRMIGEQLGTQRVWLLNDLEATAWGVLDLPGQDFVELNPDAQRRPGNSAIAAAGTGLGEAIIAWDGSRHQIIATEGGHADFAPTNEQEIDLLRFMMKKYPEHVSCERLLSGEGLVAIYQFLKTQEYAPALPETEQRMISHDPAAVIGEAGVNGIDALCVEALALFCRLYGAESGNLALKCLPYAGIYLGGGIGAKILPFLKQGEFMRGFLAKGRYRSILREIPVKVCTNPEAALLGALNYAEKQVAQNSHG